MVEKDLIKLGYKEDQVLKMTTSFPTIYSYSIDNIKQKIEDMKKLGYKEEQVLKMTVSLPTIYGLSIDNIKEKVDLYRKNHLEFIILDNTSILMQSTKLSYARLMFFADKGVEIDYNNYGKIFVGQKMFEKKYGMNNNTLCEIYKYDGNTEKRK